MRKKKTTSDNPEVQEAMDARDALMEDVKGAVEKAKDAVETVDRLMKQYAEANGVGEDGVH